MALHENLAVKTREEAMSNSGTWTPATVRFEIEASMYTYITSRTSSTSALMNIELGGNRSTFVTVHNVPEQVLDQAMQETRVRRPVTIGAFNEEDGAISILKRVNIGNVEYHLTA